MTRKPAPAKPVAFPPPVLGEAIKLNETIMELTVGKKEITVLVTALTAQAIVYKKVNDAGAIIDAFTGIGQVSHADVLPDLTGEEGLIFIALNNLRDRYPEEKEKRLLERLSLDGLLRFVKLGHACGRDSWSAAIREALTARNPSPEALFGIVRNWEEFGERFSRLALDLISNIDAETLQQVARTTDNREIFNNALQKLGGSQTELLMEIALNEASNMRCVAIAHLPEDRDDLRLSLIGPDAQADVAFQALVGLGQEEPIRQAMNRAPIASIAMAIKRLKEVNRTHYAFWQSVMTKTLLDPAVLVELAKRAEGNRWVLDAAIPHIDDQMWLARIVIDTGAERVRPQGEPYFEVDAINRITEPEALFLVCEESQHSSLQQRAAHLLRQLDEENRTRFARRSRKFAVGYLVHTFRDIEVTLEIIESSNFAEIDKALPKEVRQDIYRTRAYRFEDVIDGFNRDFGTSLERRCPSDEAFPAFVRESVALMRQRLAQPPAAAPDAGANASV